MQKQDKILYMLNAAGVASMVYIQYWALATFCALLFFASLAMFIKDKDAH